MAFNRPTLADLVARIQADIESRLEFAGAVLRRALVRVLAVVYAGAAHLLHGHIEYLSKQLFADQSDDPYLVRQAGVFAFAKTAPGFAKATITCTGTNGTVIPAGSALQRLDGTEYTTDADVTVSSGTATPSATAVLAGAAGTLDVGVALAFQAPIAGVNSDAVVASVVQDGSDLEGTEAFRARFLEFLRTPPQGGADADYVAWAKKISGVTRAWCYPQELGAGTVVVRFVRDLDVGGPIPDSGEVAAVQAYIDSVRPVTATVTVEAPTTLAVNYTLHIVPDTTALRAAVTAQLTALHQRTEPGVTLYLSRQRATVEDTVGLTDSTFTAPISNTVPSVGQLPVLGTVTFV